jgi:hypothetical protein
MFLQDTTGLWKSPLETDMTEWRPAIGAFRLKFHFGSM